MASTGRYKAYRSGDVELDQVGYYKAWISLLSDFTTIQEPVLSGTPVIGEKYTIGGNHAWTAGQEPVPVYVKKETIEAPAESQGDSGSIRLLYTPKIFVIGDGPVILEMINNWLNEELILFVTDGCSPTQRIQFGCDCLPVTVQKASFTSGTLKSGAKGYELTLESYCKYFYNGTWTERA
jgi:hypothetical protein